MRIEDMRPVPQAVTKAARSVAIGEVFTGTLDGEAGVWFRAFDNFVRLGESPIVLRYPHAATLDITNYIPRDAKVVLL